MHPAILHVNVLVDEVQSLQEARPGDSEYAEDIVESACNCSLWFWRDRILREAKKRKHEDQ